MDNVLLFALSKRRFRASLPKSLAQGRDGPQMVVDTVSEGTDKKLPQREKKKGEKKIKNRGT